MPALTDAQRLSFETNGYLVIPEALSQDELASVRRAADAAEARWRTDTSLKGWRTPRIEQVQAPIEYDDLLFDLLEHPAVFPLIRDILGDDVSMIDNDYFISPARCRSHTAWHHDVGMAGVYHPRSVMMVKAFYILEDIPANGGATLLLPGSHRYPLGFALPQVDDPSDMPNAVKMALPAGSAFFFNGRTYHSSSHNDSDSPRRVLIYNYGHAWMRIWEGYEPSEALRAKATTPLRRQLLGMTNPYGPYAVSS
ncbi:phytanoyl-CoA dioxygenase family protein [Candidatus Poribacteria bacterium]|nr:phytanoyl-CoA dioxygenase family protein [Candidatus Poribacteria bacterium]